MNRTAARTFRPLLVALAGRDFICVQVLVLARAKGVRRALGNDRRRRHAQHRGDVLEVALPPALLFELGLERGDFLLRLAQVTLDAEVAGQQPDEQREDDEEGVFHSGGV